MEAHIGLVKVSTTDVLISKRTVNQRKVYVQVPTYASNILCSVAQVYNLSRRLSTSKFKSYHDGEYYGTRLQSLL